MIDLGLADLLDARILEAGQRAGVGHVGVEHGRALLRLGAMHGHVDAVGGLLDVAGAALELAVEADLHEATRP